MKRAAFETNEADLQAVRPRVLVVDDIEENLVALSALMAEDDVELLLAHSGDEALEILLRTDVALALVDVHMPEMDGYELAEVMRASPRTSHVPILFVTAGAPDEARIFRGYEAGAVDYLIKPIQPLVLQNKVRTFLRLHRQQAELARRLEKLQAAAAERQRLVDELRETLRLNELYLAALSHDLRSPLAAISASAGLLRRLVQEEKQRSLASRIVASSEAMADMLDSLLDLAQARVAGSVRLRTEPVHLPEILDRVIAEHQLLFPGRAIDVQSEGNLRGVWDPARLHRLFANLIGNALQHGARNGPVRVHLDGTDPDRVRLRVSNEGAIPPGLVGDLFNPFRGSSFRDRNGLGLGLFSAQQIARAHGGDVEVRSSEEEGTHVDVTLARNVEA